ncbi:MAG: lysophospholipid acyltransferase family protein [Planctomycetota bacterium]
MHRHKLSNEIKYRFFEPKHSPIVMWLGQLYTNRKLRNNQKIHEIRFHGLEKLQALIGQGDGILLTPNHSDHADSALMFHMGRFLKKPFYFMATHAIFEGWNRFFLTRIGCFPVDREGTDLKALRKAQEILTLGQTPLVIFPEGEIYRLNDQITPLREGVAAVALMSARKAREHGRKVWIVPIGIKYRFLESVDPVPWLTDLLTHLEKKFDWREVPDRPLLDRIYRYASGMLSLKEIEYMGAIQAGSPRERVARLREYVLVAVEQKLKLTQIKAKTKSIPERVKECRRVIIDRWSDPERDPKMLAVWKQDLEDLFMVVQLYSYPGDYVMNSPTCERASEILIKFKQDAMRKDLEIARHHVPRRASIYIGEPIDVQEFVQSVDKKSPVESDPNETASKGHESAGKSRKASSLLTLLLETRLQELLNLGDRGKLLPDAAFHDSQNQAP